MTTGPPVGIVRGQKVGNMTETRKEWERQKHRFKKTHTPQCKRCGYFAPWESGCGLAIHHITSIVDGGGNESDNLIVLCEQCHSEWHRMYEGKIPFERFMQKPPLYLLGIVEDFIYGKTQDHYTLGEQIYSVDDLIHNWANIRDELVVKQPYKNERCKEYVKQHCKDWVDW